MSSTSDTYIANKVILDSLALDKRMKKYFHSKFKWLVRHNGADFASDKFSEMKTILLAYRADPNRISKLDYYLNLFPSRKNGWVKMAFLYMDTNPEVLLQLFKLYTSFKEPLVSVETSSGQHHSYLKGTRGDTHVPAFLTAWLDLISSKPLKRGEYRDYVYNAGFVRLLSRDRKVDRITRLLQSFGAHHSYDEYLRYHLKWKAIVFRGTCFSDAESLEHIDEKVPLPEVYKQFSVTGNESLERDLLHLFNAGADWGSSLSPKSISFIYSFLNPGLLDLQEQYLNGMIERTQMLPFYIGATVGSVHHIPKTGTVKRRPIAVPNRFVQMGLAPLYKRLEEVVKRLPHDATYDQDKFDTVITNRVTNQNLYIGSVDLSKATDNLPVSWGWSIIDRLKLNGLQLQSLDLFRDVTEGKWDNDSYLTSWQQGQPLGSLPSFMVLSITHNLFLESLAFSLGYGHSPYRVLGDDVVIMTKKLRKTYISELTKRGIPLSLHKSFEGNLTEFAGKTYVRNMRPFYTSDHNPLTWESLFDYQRATGVKIPFNKLPSKLKRKFSRRVEDFGLPSGRSNEVYSVILSGYVLPRGGQNVYDIDTSHLSKFYYWLEGDEVLSPEPDESTGIFQLFGHPVTYANIGYAEKQGHLLRYNRILPTWFESKFRPCTTDHLLVSASKALRDIKTDS